MCLVVVLLNQTDNFSEEVRNDVLEFQNHICKLCYNRIDDFHHKLHNTELNRKLYPIYTQSIFNCVGLCRSCHDSGVISIFKVTPKEAGAYERYLKSNDYKRNAKKEG